MNRVYILFLFLVISLFSYSQDNEKLDSVIISNEIDVEELLQKAEAGFPDSVDITIEYAIEAINITKENNQLELEAKSYLLYGEALLLKFDKSKALKALFEARSIAEQISNNKILIEANLIIGQVYSNLNKQEESFDYSTQALLLAEKTNDLENLPSINNNIAKYYYEIQDYKNSLIYLTKSYEGFLLLGDSLSAITPFQNTVRVYYKLNDTVKALNTELQAVEMLSKLKIENILESSKISEYYFLKTSLTINLGSSMSMQKRYEEALIYTKQGIEIAKKNNFLEWKARGYHNLSEIYSQVDDFENAYKAITNFNLANDSLIKVEQRDKIEAIILENEAMKAEKKINSLLQKSKIQRIYVIVASIFSVLAFLFFILNYNRLKLKNKLHDKEKTEFDLRMNQKSREIISSAMLISEKIKAVKSIKENIDNITLGSDSPYIGEFNEVKRKLRETIQIDNNWEKIKLHFEEINPTFFKRLKKAHPSLSENELKHCAYIFMNINTTDVAQLMNINIRSLQTARYRIKKKMELDKDRKLYEELFKFGFSVDK